MRADADTWAAGCTTATGSMPAAASRSTMGRRSRSPVPTTAWTRPASSSHVTGSPWISVPTRPRSYGSSRPATSKPAAAAYSTTSAAKLRVPTT